MQAYSNLYFEQPDSAWKTYADDWASARAWQAESSWLDALADSESVVTDDPLPETLKLSALVGFLRQPLDVHYRHRLGMSAPEPEPELPDAEPFELNALEAYHWVLQAFDEPEDWIMRAKTSGSLPLGDLALHPLSDIQAKSEVLRRRLAQALSPIAAWHNLSERVMNWTPPVSCNPLGVKTISGTIGGVHWHQNSEGQVIQILPRPGAVAKKKALQIHSMLGAWVHHLWANACGVNCTTHVLGLDRSEVLAAMSSETAGEHLAALLKVYAKAWEAPLPLPGRSACAWMGEFHKPSTQIEPGPKRAAAHQVARSIFDGQYPSQREPEKMSVPMMRRHAQEYNDILDLIEPWASTLYMGLIQALGPDADHEGHDDT
jgi:exodeoxyribonuclease V gamma subunit